MPRSLRFALWWSIVAVSFVSDDFLCSSVFNWSSILLKKNSHHIDVFSECETQYAAENISLYWRSVTVILWFSSLHFFLLKIEHFFHIKIAWQIFWRVLAAIERLYWWKRSNMLSNIFLIFYCHFVDRVTVFSLAPGDKNPFPWCIFVTCRLCCNV